MPISLLFFSGAELSLPLLEALAKDDRFEIKAVFCKPDKPVGRNLEMHEPAPKQLANRYGLPVFQPERLADASEILAHFQSDRPDFLLTLAYGQLMPQDWLDLAKLAPLNVHVSLLPKYRGASPVQSAILNGDQETGYSLMKMVKAMDAGPVAFQEKLQISNDMTAGELHDALANLASQHVPDQLVTLSQKLIFSDQDENEVTFCSKVSRDDGFLDFKSDNESIYRQFKAYTPWPGVWTKFEGKRLKLLKLKPVDQTIDVGKIQWDNEHLYVGCLEGSIEIIELQLEGKNALSVKDFCSGQSSFVSSQLPS